MLTSISSFVRLSATTGICRKSIRPWAESEVDQNKYEKAVHFLYGGADYYPGGKRKWFDGKITCR